MPLAETMLDHPVAQIEHANNAALGGSNGTGAEAVLYLRTDELATPREARNVTGTVVWSWTSAAFGDTNPAEDPDGNGQRTIVNLRFPGQYADQEAGLHYNGHRSYDPATGRYLESDPIGLMGGANTFAYVFLSPLMLADPLGLDVRVCFFPGGPGHVGIGLTTESGTYGFYPTPGNRLRSLRGDVPGEIRRDPTSPDARCKTAAADPEQDACVVTCRLRRIETPGNYNLYTRQCTSFVRECLIECGFSGGLPRAPIPEGWFDSLPYPLSPVSQ